MLVDRGYSPRPGRKSGSARSRPGVEPLEGRALLSGPGSLVPTFGHGGTVTQTTSTVNDLSDIAVQKDGKIVAVGIVSNRSLKYGASVLIRFNHDGTFDTSFGNKGIVADFLTSKLIPTAVLVQPDGKIVVGLDQNVIFDAGPAGQVHELLRYNPDGRVDTTFGDNGTVNEAPVPITSLAQDGNQIVFTGPGGPGSTSFQVGRLNDDGTPDPNFGTNGVATAVFPGAGPADAWALAVGPQGNIVVVGSDGAVAALATFSPGGAVVSTTTTAIGNTDQFSALAIQPDGKIVAAGYADLGLIVFGSPVPSLVLARYQPDLSLDTGFGNRGKVVDQLDSLIASGVAVQPDGEIVAVGDNGEFAFATAFRPDGRLSTTFGTGGLVFIDALGRAQQSGNPVRVALDPTDDTIVIGASGVSSDFRDAFGLGRLEPATLLTPPPAVPAYVFQGLYVKAPARRAFTHPVADLVLPSGFPAADRSLFSRAVIAWGDGRSSVGRLARFRGAYAVVGTHVYSRAGTYRTTVSFLGASGGTTNVTHGTIVAG